MTRGSDDSASVGASGDTAQGADVASSASHADAEATGTHSVEPMDYSAAKSLVPKTVKYNLLALVTYDPGGAVLRLCDKTANDTGPSRASLFSCTAITSCSSRAKAHMSASTKGPRKKSTRQQLADLKLKCRCKKCGRFGRWASDHAKDGSVPDGVLSNEAPIPTTNGDKPVLPERSITFNCANLDSRLSFMSSTPSNVSILPPSPGPLVDTGAPYSAIGYLQLAEISPLILPCFDRKLHPIPEHMEEFRFWQ